MTTEKRKTYFISDIHLGAKYIPDRKKHERIIVEMLELMSKDAGHIYLLGDILDYWFEYRTVVPRGYVRFFGKLAELVDKGIGLTWIIGNHDIWLFDYLRDEIGIEIIDGALIRNIDGALFYLAHGDDLGNLLKPSFNFIRSVFRNKVCQKLYSAIHPRWTIPFAHKWSNGSRTKNAEEYPEWKGDDVEPSLIFAKEYLKNVNPLINYFVMGHRHVAVERQLSAECMFILLGDGYRLFSYGVWDGQNVKIEHFDASTI